MIRRIVVVESSAKISASRSQIQIESIDKPILSVPAEDLGSIVVESNQTLITTRALQSIAKKGGSLVTCDEKFMPAGIFLPLKGHFSQTKTIRNQVNCSLPTKKRIWKEIITGKLENQARVLEAFDTPSHRLSRLSSIVKSGDPENLEAQGARIYWKTLFGKDFRREIGGEKQNALLNYGYAVLRAIIARNAVACGLHPSIGIHHSNQFNAFCLIDDLIEPFRPFVDRIVRRIMDEKEIGMTKVNKALLINVLKENTIFNKSKFQIETALPHYVKNFSECIEKRKKLHIPLLS